MRHNCKRKGNPVSIQQQRDALRLEFQMVQIVLRKTAEFSSRTRSGLHKISLHVLSSQPEVNEMWINDHKSSSSSLSPCPSLMRIMLSRICVKISTLPKFNCLLSSLIVSLFDTSFSISSLRVLGV